MALLFDQCLKLALHCLESVVDHFAERLVHFVRALFFIGHQLVAGRDGNIDSDPEWIAGMLRVVGMLNDDVAAADVIAKTIQPRGFVSDELVELIGFLDASI
jgi:hypothetical protein